MSLHSLDADGWRCVAMHLNLDDLRRLANVCVETQNSTSEVVQEAETRAIWNAMDAFNCIFDAASEDREAMRRKQAQMGKKRKRALDVQLSPELI